MAQFRTTADAFLEVLQKAGEPQNGNSPFQTVALTYLNRAHQAIICGGSIINLNVDEPWIWARHRFPMVLNLQPAYNTGAVSMTNGDFNIYFSQAPAASLEGWHFQVLATSTVYKITSHAAGSTAAQIDSAYVDSGTGLYGFRAFQLDYQVYPTLLYVDNQNDQIDFIEVNSTASSVTRSTTMPHGSYTPNNFIGTLAAQMNAASGTASYSGAFDSVARTFALTCAAVSLTLPNASGVHVRRSIWGSVGFDKLDYTGAQAYTSAYVYNRVGRLIEPFRLFTQSWYNKEGYIYSDDPVKMGEDYNISLTEQRLPDRFCRLTEDPSGNIWVRFNCYPTTATKVSLDWTQHPLDLQNNTASVPALPRTDVDTLIHAAAAMILYDKSDSKWESMLNLAKTGLDAMKVKNHGALFRTGQHFGQQIPRVDMDRQYRRLRFGYTVSGNTAAATTASQTEQLFTSQLAYTQFQTAATVASITASTLAANMSLFSLIVKHSAVWTGSGLTGVYINVGTQGNPTQFLNAFQLNQPVSSTASEGVVTMFFPAVATPLVAQIFATGGNLNALTQGALSIYFQELVTQ